LNLRQVFPQGRRAGRCLHQGSGWKKSCAMHYRAGLGAVHEAKEGGTFSQEGGRRTRKWAKCSEYKRERTFTSVVSQRTTISGSTLAFKRVGKSVKKIEEGVLLDAGVSFGEEREA